MAKKGIGGIEVGCAVAIVLAIALVFVVVIQFGWNTFVSPTFNVGQITLIQSAALVVLLLVIRALVAKR